MPFNLDHIIPKSRNGPNIIENFATMCAECNSRKDNLSLDEYFQLYQKDKQCLSNETSLSFILSSRYQTL